MAFCPDHGHYDRGGGMFALPCPECSGRKQKESWEDFKPFGCLLLLVLGPAILFPATCARTDNGTKTTEIKNEKPTNPPTQNPPPKLPKRSDPVVPEPPLQDPTPPKTDDVPVIFNGTLVLKSRAKIVAGAVAWVEIDGTKKADWPVGSDEVQLTVVAGSRKVAVYSIYQGVRRQIYSSSVVVDPGETKVIGGL